MASERPTCETCPYWKSDIVGSKARKARKGSCFKLLPPEGAKTNHGRVYTERRYGPSVAHDDFCGKHPDFPAWLAARKEGKP